MEHQADQETAGDGVAGRDVAVLVCGSRDWTDQQAVREQLERAVARLGADRLVVIAGRARGADSQGESWARKLGLAVEVYPTRWDDYGRLPAQRVRMLDRFDDFSHRYVITFPNACRGTQHTVDQARQRGIPVRVIGNERRAG